MLFFLWFFISLNIKLGYTIFLRMTHNIELFLVISTISILLFSDIFLFFFYFELFLSA